MKPKAGTIALAAILLGMLGFVVWALIVLWRRDPGVQITMHGWIALGIAGLGTLALGGGLMWLAFYSANKGYDDIDER